MFGFCVGIVCLCGCFDFVLFDMRMSYYKLLLFGLFVFLVVVFWFEVGLFCGVWLLVWIVGWGGWFWVGGWLFTRFDVFDCYEGVCVLIVVLLFIVSVVLFVDYFVSGLVCFYVVMYLLLLFSYLGCLWVVFD